MIAGKTNDRRLILDAPCYPGTSGALVLEVNEDSGRTYLAAGMVSRAILFTEKLHSIQFNTIVSMRHENSGYALVEPMDRVTEIIAQLSSHT
jgi:hypothetical protein